MTSGWEFGVRPMVAVLVVVFYLISPSEAQTQGSVVTAVPPRTQDYPNQVPGSCGSTSMFDCGNGQCIAFSSVRNCISDCTNGADEFCGINLSLCDTNINIGSGCGKCVVAGSEETNCIDSAYVGLCARDPTTIVKCRSTPNCVVLTWLNDNKNDCGDGSDEDPCFTNTSGCSSNADCSYSTTTNTTSCTCRSGYSGDGRTCTLTGSTPAPNRTDILNRIPGACSSNPLQFDCGSNLCLPIARFRDCRNDCPDGIDETCWVGQIRCDGCKCVDPEDVATQCTNSQNCALNGQFACVGGGCVFDAMVLDGTPDCADGSDENYCSLYLTSCPNGGRCVYDATVHNFTCACTPPLVPDASGICRMNSGTSAADCADVQSSGASQSSGIQTITIPNCLNAASCTKQVYCDYETEGGGWTLVQRRIDGSVDFFRNWTDYRNGFGTLTGEYWIGNEYLAQLTNRNTIYELLILMTTTENTPVRARYNLFRVGFENDYYRLRLGDFIQGDNDNLVSSRNMRFGSYDMDTDNLANVVCGIWWRSGWWFDSNCGSTGNLNVPYAPVPQYGNLAGILWPGTARSARMRSTMMMMRPYNYRQSDDTNPPLFTGTRPPVVELSGNCFEASLMLTIISLVTVLMLQIN